MTRLDFQAWVLCRLHFMNSSFTARKRSLRRLCFYTCLSFCSQGGGGVSRSTPKGKVGGSGWGVSWPTPRGEVGGMPWECLGPHPGGMGGLARGYPGPHLGGGSRPRPMGGGVPACTQPDTPPPPQHAATAPGGTHPTGMHSCIWNKLNLENTWYSDTYRQRVLFSVRPWNIHRFLLRYSSYLRLFCDRFNVVKN